jgi:hypothetical protein
LYNRASALKTLVKPPGAVLPCGVITAQAWVVSLVCNGGIAGLKVKVVVLQGILPAKAIVSGCKADPVSSRCPRTGFADSHELAD